MGITVEHDQPHPAALYGRARNLAVAVERLLHVSIADSRVALIQGPDLHSSLPRGDEKGRVVRGRTRMEGRRTI